MEDQEKIVMTPTKQGKRTTIKIEKQKQVNMDSVAHTAGGQHSGLVINKESSASADVGPAQLQLEFKCFLVDAKTGNHVPEQRTLKFWFATETDYLDKVTGAYEFFKELVKPDTFPRDYVGFIKVIMKQMQQERYRLIKKVDVDLLPLEQDQTGPSPGPDSSFRSASGLPKEDTRPQHVVVQEQLLMTLESAYPNILPLDDLARITGAEPKMIMEQLNELKERKLINEMEPGRFVREVLDTKTEVKEMKMQNMMAVQGSGSSKPTVAIITSKYYEKLAVDTMMEDRTTFVKFKSEGESNVYTVGYIGKHKVVSTKLPAIGRQMAAQIAAGNTTTRLLGTFGDVEHVFLVGVSGGVPHYTDFHKHTRLGDIIVGAPNPKGYMYIYCDTINHDKDQGQVQYTLKSWSPSDLVILEKVDEVIEKHQVDPSYAPWERYIKEGQESLQGQEVKFTRPSPQSDRLYMNIGGNDVIEVGHPPVPEEDQSTYRPNVPHVHKGALAAGKPIVKEDALRLDFASRHDCVSFDTEFDQCLESIVGNRKDSFIFIRGVSDYLDGTKNVEWQPYSSLVAASFMKTVIEQLPPP